MHALTYRGSRGVRPTPGSTAALISVKRKAAQLHVGSGCMWVCECVRNLRLFTDNLTQSRISLHFLDWMAVLCARPSSRPQSLLCSGISQYLLTHCIHPVTHQYAFLCVCQTYVLEMWLSVSLRLDKLLVGVSQRCTNPFRFHCSNFGPLSVLRCFTFIPV